MRTTCNSIDIYPFGDNKRSTIRKGDTFGEWTVKRARTDDKQLVVCRCGFEAMVSRKRLRAGVSTGCGSSKGCQNLAEKKLKYQYI